MPARTSAGTPANIIVDYAAAVAASLVLTKTVEEHEYTVELSPYLAAIGATDALAGIDIGNSKVIIRDPNGRIDSTNAIVASGTNTYKASPVLRRGSAPGIWKIDVLL